MDNDFEDIQSSIRGESCNRKRKPSSDIVTVSAGEDSEIPGDAILSTALGKSMVEGARWREENKKRKSHHAMVSSASGVGSFEKHTKGIGSKLLEQMGYKGGGLGKNQQGIVAPIAAKPRPRNLGMGYNDFNETDQAQKYKPELDTEFAFVPDRILKSKKTRERFQTNAVRTAGQHVLRVEKVLDMRGPQVQVVTDLKNLNLEMKAADSQDPLLELQRNIPLMIEMAELDIEKIDRSLRNTRDSMIALKEEKDRLEAEAGRHKSHLEAMEQIVLTLNNPMMTLESLHDCFAGFQRRHPEEYKLCDLSCIAVSLALPLFVRFFHGWDPLRDPSRGMDFVSSWKKLLHGGEDYSRLLFEVVVPAVRISGVNTWRARDPEPMLGFLGSWESLLTRPALEAVLDQVVLPKLRSAVESWEPHRETVPIHVWVHPWLPLLGHDLDEMYNTIRIKIGEFLVAWHPSDPSAFALLSPWKPIFDNKSWENLMSRFIVPKLHQVLQEFHVNPADQKLEEFYWVISWASVAPIHLMVDMMVRSFFPEWLQVLYHWLVSNPDFGEVAEWFLCWKDLLPKEILADKSVKNQLNCALAMMNQAAEGKAVDQPGMKEKLRCLRAAEQKASAERFKQQASPDVGRQEMSFKEVVESFAQQHSLLFKPKRGRTHNGHEIYFFGNVSILLDSFSERVYAKRDGSWSLLTLEALLEFATRQ